MKPPESMTNFQTLERILKMASEATPGDFAEIGVAHGGTSYRLYQIAEEQNRKLHLFDFDFSDSLKQQWCPKATFHKGSFPETWVGVNNIAFCFFDIANIELAKSLISKMPTDFAEKGIALFYPANKGAIDYNVYPDWALVGGGNMRYPYISRR